MNKDILKFIKSKDLETEYKYNKYNKDRECILIKDIYKDNLMLLYYKDNSNALRDIELRYIGTFDVDSLELLHVSRDNYNMLDMEHSNMTSINRKNENIIYDIEEKVRQYFSENEKELLKTIDLSKYEDFARSEYCKPYPEIYKPSVYVELNINKPILYEINKDKNKFIEKKAKETVEKHKEEYMEYLGKRTAYEQFKEAMQEDPIMQRKEAMCNIIKSSKYKNIKIHYTKPNEQKEIYEYRKDDYRYRNTNSTILRNDKIDDIPILSIDKITWGRSTIYDNSNFPPIEYTQRQMIKDFINLRRYNDLPKKYYKDKKFMSFILKESLSYINLLDAELQNDNDFLFDIIQKTNEWNVFTFFKAEVWNDDEFVKKCLDYTITHKRNVQPILTKCNDTIFDNFEDMSKYYTNLDDSARKTILNRANPVIINSKRFEKIAKDMDTVVDPIWLKKIVNADLLLKLVSPIRLMNNLNHCSSEVMNDRMFILYLLDNTDKLKFHNYEPIIDMYKNDEEIINKIVQKIKISSYYNLDIKKFLKAIDLEETDVEKIYELASLNIEFLEILTNKDQANYLEGEIAGYETIENPTYSELRCKTPFGVMMIIDREHLSPIIKYIDENNNTITVDEITVKEKIVQALIDEVKYRNPSFEFDDLTELRRRIDEINKTDDAR